MSESEFDKQVQQELQGLRLRPSEAVWENVEKELRRKRKRRVIIVLWLIAATGLLSYSGYRLMRINETPMAGTAVATQDQQPVTSAGNGSSQSPGPALAPSDATGPVGRNNTTEQVPVSPGSAAEISGQKPVDQQQPGAVPQGSNANLSSGKPGQVTMPASPVANYTAKQEKAKQPVTVKGGRRNKSSENKSPRPNNPQEEDRAIAESKKAGTTPATPRSNDPAPVNAKPVTTEPAITGEIAGSPAEKNTVDSVVSGKDSALAMTMPTVPEQKTAKAKKKGASKMKWSLDLAAGASGPIASPFFIGNGAEKVLVADNLNASPNQGGVWSPVTPPGTFGPIYVPRSDIKPGPAARVGILVELPVSQRVSLSTGLQYQYQSNNIRIGYYKDTSLVFSNFAAQTVSVRAVYQGAQQKTFTNRFHSIQIPLNFHWQMNEGKKLPLLLNAGISAGYLISTNGLLYDSLQGGTYYHEKKAFNRLQLNISTGVSFRFGTNKALQWSIGPEVSMGLRRMIKAEYDKKQYPVFIGLQGRIYLPGRKR